MRVTVTSLLAVLLATPLVLLAGPSSAQPAVRHGFVWDAGERQAPRIKIVAAGPDGSDQRVIFQRDRGFVTDLELNPRGTEVAMAPFRPSERRAELLVVDVRTGARRDLLAGDRRFEVLGAIGWSPNGRHLVFEGFVDEGKERNGYLWTIGADGRGLRRLEMLPFFDDGERQWVFNRHLPWTRHGIYFNGVEGLMLRSHGDSRQVLAGARLPMLSGNGRWLFVARGEAARPRIWRMHPGGSSLERTAVVWGRTRAGWVTPLAPSRSGDRMLSHVSGPHGNPTVEHDVMRAPRQRDPGLPFLENVYTVDWN